MQRMAAEAFARGHATGIEGMQEAIPGLVKVLTAESSHPAARQAAARALVALDFADSAPQLAESASKFGADLRLIAEPALARWDYQPMRQVWFTRLEAPATGRQDLVLAIRCLAVAGDSSAVPLLLELVHRPAEKPATRLEAAQAAGLLRDQGLEPDARRLLAGPRSPALLNRLCAAKLLAKHDGTDARSLLQTLAADAEPAVAVLALARLVAIDPHQALELAEKALQSADPKLRQSGVDAFARAPDPARVAALARLLDDPHPAVRASVRESLYDIAQRPDLADPVHRSAMEILAGNSWRGLEQAALLLAALGHHPAAARLIELLDFNRPEVNIAAAWGLKTLAVPETMPALLEVARRRTDFRLEGKTATGLDDHTGHLLEAFGKVKYAPAEGLLRQHVPKDFQMGLFSRSAAIWSLGRLHEGVPDEKLAGQLLDRLTDEGMIREVPHVKYMSAVSLARMKAVSRAEAIRQYVGPDIPPTRLGMTIRWALIELTGEKIPEPEYRPASKADWFLEPLDEN